MDFNPWKKASAPAAHAPDEPEAAPAPAPAPPAKGQGAAQAQAQAPPPAQPSPRPSPRQMRDVGVDCCRPCRATWNAVLRALGSTKVVTGLAVALPCVYLIIVLAITSSENALGLGAQTYANFMTFRAVATGAGAVITTLTGLGGLLGGFAVFQGMQNVLGLASWFYRVIAHWFLIMVLVILFSAFSWIQGLSAAEEFKFVGALFGYVSPPIVIYLLSAGVMDAHRRIINDRIDAARRALAAQDGVEGGGAGYEHEEIAVDAPPPPGKGRR